jgi:D-ribose pyranase
MGAGVWGVSIDDPWMFFISTGRADLRPAAAMLAGNRPRDINERRFRMIIQGILNPQINSLLARVRHTNALVIADRGFPFWPAIETVDISLVDDVPTVLQVFQAIRSNFEIREIFMAREFLKVNTPEVRQAFSDATAPIPLCYETHVNLKKRVPSAIGLIHTGDTIQFANMVIISGPIQRGRDRSK